MASNKKLLVLPGDGVGPEVMREVVRVIDWMDRRRRVSFDLTEDLVGGAAIDARGIAITEETVARAKEADAVLFGSVGGPKWDTLGFDKRPELAMSLRFPAAAPEVWHGPGGQTMLDVLELLQSPFEPAGANIVVYQQLNLTAMLSGKR